MNLRLGVNTVCSTIGLGIARDDYRVVVRVLFFPRFNWDAFLLVNGIGILIVEIFLLAVLKVILVHLDHA